MLLSLWPSRKASVSDAEDRVCKSRQGRLNSEPSIICIIHWLTLALIDCGCGDGCGCGSVSHADLANFKTTDCPFSDCSCGVSCGCGASCTCGGSKQKTDIEWLAAYKAKVAKSDDAKDGAKCSNPNCKCNKNGGVCNCGEGCKC